MAKVLRSAVNKKKNYWRLKTQNIHIKNHYAKCTRVCNQVRDLIWRK